MVWPGKSTNLSHPSYSLHCTTPLPSPTPVHWLFLFCSLRKEPQSVKPSFTDNNTKKNLKFYNGAAYPSLGSFNFGKIIHTITCTVSIGSERSNTHIFPPSESPQLMLFAAWPRDPLAWKAYTSTVIEPLDHSEHWAFTLCVTSVQFWISLLKSQRSPCRKFLSNGYGSSQRKTYETRW